MALEPVVGVARRSFKNLSVLFSILLIGSGSAFADGIAGTDTTNNIASMLSPLTGWHPTNPKIDFETLVNKARAAVEGNRDFKGIFADNSVGFATDRALADATSTTIKFRQTYNGLEVVGHEAMVHFDRNGEIHDVAGKALDAVLATEPTVSLETAHKLLDDRAGEHVTLTEASQLKILKDFSGQAHLVYHFLTRTTPSNPGEQLFLDAHTGQMVLAFPRALEAGNMGSGPRTVYTADTEEAHQHVDKQGYPTDLNPAWYVKVIQNGRKSDQADNSAISAYRNAGITYAYYGSHFNRHSYDDQDSPLVSIVHVGLKMNNAFWTDEYHVMAYGDGDGAHLMDLTQDLDVGAHELTHGVTGQTAKLVYVGESGALNESFSDFFGKMVANDGNWDIGARIMAPSWGRRALRNMANPEEFKQPGTTDSSFMIPTGGPCNRQNDQCGVHTNSGVPNKAAVLIFQALGKENAEQLYYKVLTTRLTATSNFRDMRRETEAECSQAFNGMDAEPCRAVSAAFDAVRIQ